MVGFIWVKLEKSAGSAATGGKPVRKIGAPIAIVFIAATLALGCGKGGTVNPTLPSDNGSLSVQQASVQSNRHLWGLWEINISADRTGVEITPARQTEMHLNVVELLETDPCSTCLRIDNIKIVEPNVLEADVTITNPYQGLLKYTGFDVRGIFISESDFTFPVSGREIAWGDGVPRMLNPDGYTSLFNPTEYPPTNPPAHPIRMAIIIRLAGKLAGSLFGSITADPPRGSYLNEPI
jgi:hypothetical protein